MWNEGLCGDGADDESGEEVQEATGEEDEKGVMTSSGTLPRELAGTDTRRTVALIMKLSRGVL